MTDRYATMTDDEYDAILARLLDKHPASHLLSVPGVYEAVREDFNDAVLREWSSGHPEPEDDEDE